MKFNKWTNKKVISPLVSIDQHEETLSVDQSIKLCVVTQ